MREKIDLPRIDTIQTRLFTYDEHGMGGYFLVDTLAIGNMALDLYSATGDWKWLNGTQDI